MSFGPVQLWATLLRALIRVDSHSDVQREESWSSVKRGFDLERWFVRCGFRSIADGWRYTLDNDAGKEAGTSNEVQRVETTITDARIVDGLWPVRELLGSGLAKNGKAT
jgi:hypothetical protein